MIAGLLPIAWMKLFSIVHGLNVLFFSGSILHVEHVGNDWGFDLGDSSSPSRIWKALSLHTLLSAYVFLITLSSFNFKAGTSCHVSFSTVYTLCFIWALICFVTCVVIFASISVNFFSSASCICVSVFVAFMTYYWPVLVNVYIGIWWLSGDRVYGFSCKLKVRSTAVALEFFDLMKLSSIASSMNGYAYFKVLLNSFKFHNPIRKLKDKQTKLRIVSSDASVYWRYHHGKVGVQVVHNYSIAVNQVSTLFFCKTYPFQRKILSQSYRMKRTANKTKLLNNDTSITW